MLDIEKEINSHLQWRTLIEGLFRFRRTSPVPASIIVKDTECSLGKWIFSEQTSKYANDASLRKLIEVHKSFHVRASMILSLVNEGKSHQAEELTYEFYELSNQIIQLLESLKAEI